MAKAHPTPLQMLSVWLTQRPQDFLGDAAMHAIAGLLDYADAARAVEQQHQEHRAQWLLLPQDVRCQASRRQLAALAARLAMRNGMDKPDAIGWVIALGTMSRKAFTAACRDQLRNGDQLHVWQWRELVALGLREDFMSRRQLARWLELEEPWVLDARWVYPLHLVDAEVSDAAT